MKKYCVKIYEVHSTEILVMAESEQDAQSKAEECLTDGYDEDGQLIPEVEYDYTMDRDDWPVWEV